MYSCLHVLYVSDVIPLVNGWTCKWTQVQVCSALSNYSPRQRTSNAASNSGYFLTEEMTCNLLSFSLITDHVH